MYGLKPVPFKQRGSRFWLSSLRELNPRSRTWDDNDLFPLLSTGGSATTGFKGHESMVRASSIARPYRPTYATAARAFIPRAVKPVLPG
jgi:hypothetical protein